ncbi:hypothetical protein NVS89_04280 [Ancylobacter sp. MQZ15Z-1]|uniref:Invasion associated locus B family protein n=1 Tax=Ancylobacter mangrovi TaxID=2972472 RepID=A0A9X2T5W0_9HYPH|nr:hypothetical protein [Ancylobacter mangrovi]MCS0494303.1 hypothetical protein [Ancylobacter mangrovi]
MPRFARRPAHALLGLGLLGLCTAAAQARVEEGWYVATRGEAVHLVLGVPDTDETSLDISCRPGSGTLDLRSFIGSSGLTPGEAAQIGFEGMRVRAAFPGKAVANAASGRVDVEGHGPLALFERVARSGRPFSLVVEGARHIISPAGLAEPYATFAKACAKG